MLSPTDSRRHVVTAGAQPRAHTRLRLTVWPVLVAAVLLLISATPAAAEALAGITSPAANASVRGEISIIGSATHEQFDYYKVEVGPGANPVDWILVGGLVRQQVTNGELARFNTTTVPDGVYTIRLRVVDKTGNYAEARQRISVANTQQAPTNTPSPSPTGSVTVSPTVGTPTVTPTIEVPTVPTVPTIVVPAKVLTPTVVSTPQPSAGSTATAAAATKQPTGGIGLNLSNLLEPFLLGMAAAAAAFVLFGALQLLRR